MIENQLADILKEFGIEIVSPSEKVRLSQTCARSALTRILSKHGDGHLRFILTVIVETGSNAQSLSAPVIWGVSDLLAAHPEWTSGQLLDEFDDINLNGLHVLAKLNRFACPPRRGICAMLYARLAPRFETRTKPPRLYARPNSRSPRGWQHDRCASAPGRE